MNDFNSIFNNMKEKYKNHSGFELDEFSESGLRLKTLATEMADCYMLLENVKNQAFIDTAFSENLDSFALLYGITRKNESKAQGNIQFYIDDINEKNIKIPAGTLCKGNGGVLATNEAATIYSGSLSTTVGCTAVYPGFDSNYNIGDVTVLLSEELNDLVHIKNTTVISGGSEKENDSSLKNRILDRIKYIPNGSNKSFYETLGEKNENVCKANLVKTDTNTFSLYLKGYGEKVSEEIKEKTQALIDDNVAPNIKINVIAPDVTVFNITIKIKVKENYDTEKVLDKVKAEITNLILRQNFSTNIDDNDIINAAAKVEGCKSCYIVNKTNSEGTEQFFVPGNISTIEM